MPYVHCGLPTDMSNHVVGSKILKKEQVLISIFLIAILVMSSGSLVAFAKSNTYVVKPNGVDDTADIQNAFNQCGTSPECTVQLVAGTYFISQITVYGFQGKFVGMGQGMTIIKGLPNLPSPTASPFWAAMPGPSNPWPDLFTFVNGAFSISGMTVTDSYAQPTKGWVWYASTLTGQSVTYYSLYGAILITGQSQASTTIDHVTMLGAPGDVEGTNMWNGIIYGGALLPSSWSNGNVYSDILLISGTFSVTNSVFDTMQSGPWVGELDGATVTVCHNTAINTPGVTYGFFDSYASTLTFCGNQGSAGEDTAVMEGWQNVEVPPPTGVSPSTVYITDNSFRASQGAQAVMLYDGVDTLKAVVSGNTLTTDSTCTPTWLAEGWCYNAIPNPTPPPFYTAMAEGYYSVVASYDLISVVVSQNTIFGGGTGGTRVPANGIYITGGPGQVIGNTVTGSYNGVWLDTATGIQVTGNTVVGSANYGIALTETSSNNLIAHNVVMHSVVNDLYWDLTGTDNAWCGNVYLASSPSVLSC
jgi:parallel beta-helix repeat protein